jgi:exodeoxyribonuclease VII large subunit
MDLIDDIPTNAHDFTVSEIAGAVKRVIEGEFGRVRVRGEVGRVVIARTGHMYFDLKDANAVIAAVSWKGQVAKMTIRPEEGMEVIATGRLTTFAPQSKYQLQVENVEPAGAGALMAMLEARKKALAAEGLFDLARKKPIPYLPDVIGVITSPQGAVIRDILHRLADRFPRRVIVWPVAVQGERCAPEVARAIAGFNALMPGGPVPRPDVLIVARGGGSVEDLWGFNDEAVVRAAAASTIPLISAVGHETDTTLIDHAADLRAPTPTAAAELAVPVRADLQAHVAMLGARLDRAGKAAVQMRAQRLGDLSRALPRPEMLLQAPAQRLDMVAMRLGHALARGVEVRRAMLARTSGPLRPALLVQRLGRPRDRLDSLDARLAPALGLAVTRKRDALARARLAALPILRDITRAREALARASARATPALEHRIARARDLVSRLDQTRRAMGHHETLARGFALIRSPEGEALTSAKALTRARRFTIEMHDGEIPASTDAAPAPSAPRNPKPPSGQGSLF